MSCSLLLHKSTSEWWDSYTASASGNGRDPTQKTNSVWLGLQETQEQTVLRPVGVRREVPLRATRGARESGFVLFTFFDLGACHLNMSTEF